MLILIKGAGDLASGIACRLHRAGMKIIMTETAKPTMVRCTVSFGMAVLNGQAVVEDITADLAANIDDIPQILAAGNIAVLVDPDTENLSSLHPAAIVDAILAKQNTGTTSDDAPEVVAVGPGFTAGEDCHAVIESMRGHDLGRVIYKGSAIPDTGEPGEIRGASKTRLLRAPADGVFVPLAAIGDFAQEGQVVAQVAGMDIKAGLTGMIRGMMIAGTPACVGLKVGDIDPSTNPYLWQSVSDKALAIGGGVLEAILHFINRTE